MVMRWRSLRRRALVKRPSFQFYPGDWLGNAKLGRCSIAARGAWVQILCVLHDADEYGVARWSLADLARAANVPLKLAKELVSKDVLKGGEGPTSAYVFRPFHAGTLGQPVTLIEACAGPLWYSSRLVRDEYIRRRRGGRTRFSDENQSGQNHSPKPSPTPHSGDGGGDGPSSPSSSSEDSYRFPSSSTFERAPKKAARSEARGTRWGDQFVPLEWRTEAVAIRVTHSLPPVDENLQADQFANYWRGVPGSRGVKLDWRATWINWMLKAEPPRNGHGQRQTSVDKFLAGTARAVEIRRQQREREQQG